MTAAREISLQYGDKTIGGSSTSFVLTDVHTVHVGFTVARVEATFIVLGESDSDFASNIQDIEEAFRKPDQDLVIECNGSKLVQWKQSDDSGLDAMPTIVKRGDIGDTARSRLYVVRIEVGMPGGRADTDGLRTRTTAVSYDPSRRRHVTISGEFTSFNGTAARATYDAAVESMCNSLLTDLSGTFELAAELSTNTINDKSISFSRAFDEVIYDQGGGGVGSVNIVRQQFTVSRNEHRETPMGRGAQAWTVSTVTYECWIDKDKTQDLESEWTSIRSFIISTASGILGGSAVLFSDEPRYDFDNNRITATLQIATAPGDLLSYTLTVADRVQLGKVFVPVWNGRSNARYSYQGPSHYTRTVTETALTLGDKDIPDIGAENSKAVRSAVSQGKLPSLGDAGKGDWVVIEKSGAPTPRVIGTDQSRTLTEWTATTILELIEEVSPTTAGGGGSVTTPSGSSATPAGGA